LNNPSNDATGIFLWPTTGCLIDKAATIYLVYLVTHYYFILQNYTKSNFKVALSMLLPSGVTNRGGKCPLAAQMWATF